MSESTTTTDSISERAASITIENLSKVYETDSSYENVFEDLSFEIAAGSFVTLVGKSGSGKSTLLNILSDILEPTAGSVTFAVNGTPVENVSRGHVFQTPRLLPWETAAQNIELVHDGENGFTTESAHEYLDMVGLSNQYDKHPTRLSGGQKQRVGIARALSIDPDVLLMDEPFSDLDEITAEQMREELLDIWAGLQKTVIFVTHSMTEAVQLSDRILMIGDGRIYADIDVSLKRPRTVNSPEFLEFLDRAIQEFEQLENTE